MKRLLAFTLAFLLIAQQAWAVLPSVTAKNDGTAAGDLTISIVTIAGDTLYVGCSMDGIADTITVTHNGDAVTPLIVEPGTTSLTGALYRRLAPDIGTLDVLVDLSGADEIGCVVFAIADVDQGTPETNTASNEASGGTSNTGDIECPAGNLALDILALSAAVTNLAPTGGQNEEADRAVQATAWLGASTLEGAGTTTMSWGWTSSASRVQILTCIMGTGVVGAPKGPLRRRAQ